MRSAVPLSVLLLASLTAGCADEKNPEEVKNTQIRQEIESTISEIEAKARTKGKSLGMQNADSAVIDDVRAYVCNALVGQLKSEKDKDNREALAADLTEYACRERGEWLDVVRGTAKDQGLSGSAEATLNEARDFVCDRIKESLRAVKKDADKKTLQTEGRVYDCVF